MTAQAVEGFVVFFFFQVREFMHHDHFQKRFRRAFKHRRHADFRFGFQLAALNAGYRGMQPQRVFHHVDFIVVRHFA
ncbi:hypothetical protein D3C80_1660480 [compost metagenome]